MLENEVFVIDLTGCSSTGEIINSISLALEIPGASNKQINLKFKDTVLSQSQLLSIKSLVESFGSVLGKIETTSKEMQEICDSLGLDVILLNAVKIDENKIIIPEFQAGFTSKPIETPLKAQISEEPLQDNVFIQETEVQEFYSKKEPEFVPEPEFEEKDLPNQEINIEEAIHQSAQIAFENATNLDFMQEIIKEAEAKEETTPETAEEVLEHTTTPAFETNKDSVKEEDGHSMGVYKKAPDVEYEEEQIDFFAPPTDEPVTIDPKQTIYVTQTLRSGQVLEYDGNVVIIGDCHPGSEVKASGDITVWGVLGSIAHAGSTGNRDAKIRALKMNAVQLRIADCYSRRPDGTNIPYIVKSSTFTPEEARLEDGIIILYKMN